MFVIPRDGEDIANLMRYARSESIPFTVIGAGSNVIAPDEGIAGIVMTTMRRTSTVEIEGSTIKADAGITLMEMALRAARQGLGGIAELSVIPGTLGGAITMNAGTNEIEISQRLRRVELLTSSGRRRKMEKKELSFGYRTSLFQENDWVIIGAELDMEPGNPAGLRDQIELLMGKRRKRYPIEYPSAGSVFKRPPGDYAGRLIEESGCKGMCCGGAVVSERHANFILNTGRATASDILTLIERVRTMVLDRTGVHLDLEQILLDGNTRKEDE